MNIVKHNYRAYFVSLVVLGMILVFLKNAWVTEDAYITFRSIEQLFAGNGPRWNPHERVQVFTSEFWFLILSLGRIISSNLYLVTLTISLAIWCITLRIVWMFLQNTFSFTLCCLILVASNSFFDFTSSGLENILAYSILAMICFQLRQLHLNSSQTTSKICFYIGLLFVTRHDYVLMLLPLLIILLYSQRHNSQKVIIKSIMLAIGPLMIWTAFSVIYYGIPFPNTALAKLNTGISQKELLKQGLLYFIQSTCNDLIGITTVVVAYTLSYTFKANFLNSIHLKSIMLGILIYCVYVVLIGGDFMLGRFYSCQILLSSMVLSSYFGELIISQYIRIGILTMLFIVAIFCYHTPLNTDSSLNNQSIINGIVNERAYYFQNLSLYSYIKNNFQINTEQRYLSKAQNFIDSNQKIIAFDNIGLFGYYSGLDKIIVDPLALSDPLLARLPAEQKWRIGHFRRQIPKGYLESLRTGDIKWLSPNIQKIYQPIQQATQSDSLWSIERWKSIWHLNFSLIHPEKRL